MLKPWLLIDKLSAICTELSSKVGISSMKYKIGDEGEGGGIVFYVSPEGFDVYDGHGGVMRCHYLEMSKTNLGKSKWGTAVSNIQDDLGFGKSNTYKIVNQMILKGETSTVDNCAAYRCTQYKTETSKAGEWFLPNRKEAELMLATQADRLNADSTDSYWTSTTGVTFRNEVRKFTYKHTELIDAVYAVRAVRAF